MTKKTLAFIVVAALLTLIFSLTTLSLTFETIEIFPFDGETSLSVE